MRGFQPYRTLLATVALAASCFAACSDAFTAGEDSPGDEGGAGGAVGAAPATAGTTSEAGGGGSDSTSAGQPGTAVCQSADDCGDSESVCALVSCVDGACLTTPVEANVACEGGECDGNGVCQASTCDSKQRDGDETGVDCGGGCGLCPDGVGCGAGTDCLSGVCDGDKCQASACSDGVQNGDETGKDCGGPCPLKCALGQGCSVTTDCAVASGDRAHSVRCLDGVCSSTKPPSEGGTPLYWQDFSPERLISAHAMCGAVDDVCLLGNGAQYPMFGLGPDGAGKPLVRGALFTADGVVGHAGSFDGTLCLSRSGTNLSLADSGAFTAMAWVNSLRGQAPWERAIVGSLDRYFIAVDANPTSQRLLAAIGTSQAPSFNYRSSPATGQIVAGQWHHVAETYDTALAKMVQYVDGKEVHATTVSGNLTSGDAHVFVGCRKDAAFGQFFSGSLDEVVLYRRALSSAELADYVRRTKPAP
jgi:hypothetical protein